MSAIGVSTARVSGQDALARSRQRAALLPDILVQAQRIAVTSQTGWHGRRRRGVGDEFWQFRPFVEGETFSRIDWRRSARDDQVYVRDLEWQAAHTIWLWADPSPSMLFQSQQATVSKESRALVLILALAELMSRSGERVAVPGMMNPFAARNAAERIASALATDTQLTAYPDLTAIKRFNEVVIASDFLEPPAEIMSRYQELAARGIRAHLIEIADPAEEIFPYSGRTEFEDPETGQRYVAGRAETIADDYRALYLARRETLSSWARRLGWTYTVNHTDKLASEALVRVHMNLSELPENAQ